jgi:universal stress protein F
MYSRILVALELDEPASWKDAFPVAEALASCFSAQITICSVVRDAEAIVGGDWLPIAFRDEIFDARTRLDGIAGELSGSAPVHIEVGSGTICGGILDVAERIEADLIILTSHRPGLGDYLHAANAARVAGRAPCSVLIVRNPQTM